MTNHKMSREPRTLSQSPPVHPLPKMLTCNTGSRVLVEEQRTIQSQSSKERVVRTLPFSPLWQMLLQKLAEGKVLRMDQCPPAQLRPIIRFRCDPSTLFRPTSPPISTSRSNQTWSIASKQKKLSDLRHSLTNTRWAAKSSPSGCSSWCYKGFFALGGWSRRVRTQP